VWLKEEFYPSDIYILHSMLGNMICCSVQLYGPYLCFFFYKDTVYRKFPVVNFIKTPMFQPKSEQSHTDVHTCIHIIQVCIYKCEAIYDDTGVRDANFMFSKVQVSKVYTCSYSLAKSIMWPIKSTM